MLRTSRFAMAAFAAIFVCSALPSHSVAPDVAWSVSGHGIVSGNPVATGVAPAPFSAKAMAVDSSGNVYVTGASVEPGQGGNIRTMKFNGTTGALMWSLPFNGTSSADDRGQAIAIRGSNVYVAGYTADTAAVGSSMRVIKYTTAGSQEWTKDFHGSGPGFNVALGVAVDADSSVYITGYVVSGSGNAFTVTKLTADSVVAWSVPISGSQPNGDNQGYRVVIREDFPRMAIVTGVTSDAGEGYNMRTVALNAATGAIEWNQSYNGTSSGNDFSYGLALDDFGDVIVTGSSRETGVAAQVIRTIKYNGANGNQRWTAAYDGIGAGSDSGQDVAVDAFGHVLVTGYSMSTGGSFNFRTIKYNSLDGSQVWAAGYAGTGVGHDQAFAVAADGGNHVVVTGFSSDSVGGRNIRTIKYDRANGAELWNLATAGSAGGDDEGYAIAAVAGKVFVLGNSTETGLPVGFRVVAVLNPTLCAAGSWSANGQEPCIASTPGHYVPSEGATGEIACSPGTYQPFSNREACFPAPAGSHVPGSAATASTPCSAGTYQGNPGQTSCIDAPVGHFAPTAGRSSPTPCSFGSFNPLTAQTQCTQAQPGYYVPVMGATSQTPCSAGTYNPATGASAIHACIEAAQGYYVPAPGSAAATPCAAGSYQLHTGSVTCVLAQPGFYAPAPGSPNQTPCPPGTTSHVHGATACVPSLAQGPQFPDFNADGKPDLIWSNTANGAVYFWHMDGATLIGDSFVTQIDPSWKIQGVADFNGDGKPDLVWRNTANGNTYVWYMDGPTLISDAFVFALPPEWVIQGVADFNADGKPDFLMRNTVSGNAFAWFFDNATPIGDEFLFTIDPEWKVEAVAELNFDGQPDLLFRNMTSGLAFAWATQWSGTNLTLGESSPPLFGIDPVWEIVQVEDWNGDENRDLVFRNRDTGLVFVWYMTGITLGGSDFITQIDPSWEIVPRR